MVESRKIRRKDCTLQWQCNALNYGTAAAVRLYGIGQECTLRCRLLPFVQFGTVAPPGIALRLFSFGRVSVLHGFGFLTSKSNRPIAMNSMIAKRMFLVLAAGALLLFQFADCMSATTADSESMKCCAAMPCTSASHSHDCCETMPSTQTPNILLAARASLHVPVLVTFTYTRMPDTSRAALIPLLRIGPPQHSPPELYTLHASLLI